MAIRGERFLALTRARTFAVSAHALDRMAEHTGHDVTRAVAHALFARARQVRYGDLRLLGFRPDYAGRRLKGTESWYFVVNLFGEDLVAVVQRAEPGSDDYVWVTTYAPDAITERRQLVNWGAVA
jgi:hypothetical protein